MKLYEDVVTSVRFNGKKYRLTASFDRVLAAYDVQASRDIPDSDKPDLMLSLLIRGRYPADAELVGAIFEALSVQKPKGGSDVRSVDFSQDAPYIYAAFLQAYGIDLIAERGRLHWQKFLALFMSLPSDTRMSEIIGIRTRKLPKPSRYNAEERADILRLKALYGIEVSEEEKSEQMQSGLRKIVIAMKGMAGNSRKEGR